MAAYFDPYLSPLRAAGLGKRLFEQSWLEQWISYTSGWVEPVADLGSGTVTALLPDTLLTVLSEGVLSRFGGRRIDATVLGNEVNATLEVLKVRRRGAHFQTKTVLREPSWNGHPFEQTTIIAHGVRLIPGVPTKIRAARVDIDGVLDLVTLLEWLGEQQSDWDLTATRDGLIRAVHRRRRITALVDGEITDNALDLDVLRASYYGLRIPRRRRALAATPLPVLPLGAEVRRATRDGDRVRFRIEVPAPEASFDLAQLRSAIVRGTTLILF